MQLRPVNDKIVVKQIKKNEDEVTESGIILPDTVQDGKLLSGEVVAVGKGMYSHNGTMIPPICEVGDIVLYNKHAQVYDYDDDHILMSVNEVLCIDGGK